MARVVRIAEVRAEHLLTELLTAQGWDCRRPPNGEMLRQHEYKDHGHLEVIFKGKSKGPGGGDGLPEAVLVDRETLQPIAVIEVKASKADLHKAVAEATTVYGAACVEAGFNPLAVALAGTTEDDFAVRVFKWDGTAWRPVTYEGHAIGWIPNRADADRLRAPVSSPELRPSVPPPDVLADRADEINRLLRESKIRDALRPGIVAATMLALWQSKGEIRKEPSYILADINHACQQAFWKAGKPDLAKSLIVDEANAELAVKMRRIVGILERLNITVLTAEHDYLGQLYETFFRYTGGNTIGQFFTPRHIADFMAELAQVGPDDVLLDPACGTGGFLIAGMHRMQVVGKLSRTQIVGRVNRQLIGFDSEPQTAALCVANMILRGDGTTGVHRGNCLTSADYPVGKADVVLMNPPFPHEQTDTPSEAFVIRGLEGLHSRGVLAAIIPQSLMVKREKQAWRDELLKKNTLLGVISLPDELFQPFAAATTAIVVLRKGVPHPKDHKVFFARIDNDGFKLKKGTRLPRPGSQLPAVIKAYNDRLSIPRLCGWSALNPAEALWHTAAPHYVPTTALTLDEVANGVRDLARFRSAFVVRYAAEILAMMDKVKKGVLKSQTISKIKKPAKVSEEPNTIGALFDIYGGQRELHNKESLQPGASLVISSSGVDNGCYGFFDFDGPLAAPFATVPGTGSIGQAFVQEWPCGVTDHCYILVPKKNVAKEMLYVACATIRQEIWRFSYGAQITASRIAWLPLPPQDRAVPVVQAQLAPAARIEALALQEAEDEFDREVARRRLAEIAANPKKLIQGADLDKRLALIADKEGRGG